ELRRGIINLGSETCRHSPVSAAPGLLSSHRPAGAAMRDARKARVGHGAAGPHTGRWLCRGRAKPAPSPDAPRSSTVADARGIGARQSSVEEAQAPADTTP